MTLCPRTGKTGYTSRVAAARATSHLKNHGGGVRPYRCVFCGEIHVTSKPRSARNEREAIGRRRA